MKILLEPAMGKLGAEDLVLAEKQEESGREDASDRNGFRTRTPSVQSQGLAPGPVISDVLLERVQFMAEIVDALLQQVADGEHAQ